MGAAESIVLADRAVSELDWLEARRRVVTASDTIHLLNAAGRGWGLTDEQLATKKRQPGQRQPSAKMAAGSFWERHIGEYFAEATGLQVEPETRLLGSREWPWLAASPDGYVEALLLPPIPSPLADYVVFFDRGEAYHGEEAVAALREVCQQRCLLELKNQESKSRGLWNKASGPPTYYYTQATAQIAVTSIDTCILVARVDANELYCHAVHRDEFLIELMVDVSRGFYDCYLKERA